MIRFILLTLTGFTIWHYSEKTPAPPIADFVVRSGTPEKERFEKPAYRKGHIAIGLRYIICTQGQFPSTNLAAGNAGPFVGEIKIFAPVQNGILPTGWVPCDGRLLPIAGNQMLFALIGTEYGGDGRTTMAVPDLQGATVVGIGNGWAMTEKSK